MDFKAIKIIFTLLFILFISSFSQIKEEKIKEEKILEDWRNDTLGCLGYRNSEKAIYLRDSLGLNAKSKIFVLEKLGIPNFIQENKETEVFKYYFNGICRDGKLIDSVDYCWFEILFISNQVRNTSIVCY